MSYSLQPVTRDEALHQTRSAMGPAKVSTFIAIAGGIAAAVGIGYLVDDPGAPAAWITLLIGGAVCVGAALMSRQVMARIRYRITVPFAPVRLAGMLVVAFAALFGLGAVFDALDIPGGGYMRTLLILVIVGTVIYHLQISTLFMAWVHNVIFRRVRTDWSAVAALVISQGSTPGTVEIGARTVPDAPITPMRVRDGEVLTDLPLRVVVRASDFDLDKLNWAINQSGRADLVIVERTPGGERVLRQANRQQATY